MTGKNRIRTSGLAMIQILAVFVIAAGSANASDQPTVGTKVGEMFPDFLLPTVDGEYGRLSDYRGKKILLFHFASW